MKAEFGGQNSITRTEGIWAELILNSARKSNKESNRLIGELLVLSLPCKENVIVSRYSISTQLTFQKPVVTLWPAKSVFQI